MILQNRDGLLSVVRNVGCLYLSLVRLVELETEYGFSVDEINTVWDRSKKAQYLDGNNLMKEPDRVLKLLFRYAGHPSVSFMQVGISRNGKEVFWGWVADEWKNYKYMIEKVKTNGAIGTHYRLCDNQNELLYDSYSFSEYKHEQLNEYTLYARIK